MKPITPAEAESKRIEAIDPVMIQAVNELIVENLKDGEASIKQKEIVDRYFKLSGKKAKHITERVLLDNNQLDFEDVFRKSGWIVNYDKPAYYAGENYPPYFTFKKKRK